MDSSQDWFEPFKKGDKQAFSRIFDQYYRRITYYAANILHDDIRAEDIVSETFSKVWKARDTIKTPEHLKNLLYVVARNGCFSLLDKEKTKTNTEAEWSRRTAHADSDAPLDLERVRSELLEKIYQKLETLPGGNVIRMIYLEGKSTKEIAEELQISENNVFILKHRSLKELKSTFTRSEWMVFMLLFLHF